MAWNMFLNPFDTTSNTDYSPVDQENKQTFAEQLQGKQLPQEAAPQQAAPQQEAPLQQQQQPAPEQVTQEPAPFIPSPVPRELQAQNSFNQSSISAPVGVAANVPDDGGVQAMANQMVFDANNIRNSAYDDGGYQQRSYYDFETLEGKAAGMFDSLLAAGITYLISGDEELAAASAFGHYAKTEDQAYRSKQWDSLIGQGYSPQSIDAWIQTGSKDALVQQKREVVEDANGNIMSINPMNPNDRYILSMNGVQMFDANGVPYTVKTDIKGSKGVFDASGNKSDIPANMLMNKTSYAAYSDKIDRQQRAAERGQDRAIQQQKLDIERERLDIERDKAEQVKGGKTDALGFTQKFVAQKTAEDNDYLKGDTKVQMELDNIKKTFDDAKDFYGDRIGAKVARAGEWLSTATGASDKNPELTKFNNNVLTFVNSQANAILLAAKGTQTEGDANRAYQNLTTMLEDDGKGGRRIKPSATPAEIADSLNVLNEIHKRNLYTIEQRKGRSWDAYMQPVDYSEYKPEPLITQGDVPKREKASGSTYGEKYGY